MPWHIINFQQKLDISNEILNAIAVKISPVKQVEC